MSNIIQLHAPLTMTSREIAELTDKNHADVLRDIRNMLDVLKKDASSFAGIYQDAYGRDKPCFNLDRELTLTLVSGYDIALRHRVVTHLAELEAKVAKPVDPMTLLSDPATVRGLLLSYTEKVLALQSTVDTLEPKAAALDLISAGDEALTLTEAAKLLSVKRETLTTWLHANGWVYRLNGRWVAYQQHITNGRLQFKEATFADPKTGQQCHHPYCHILPKGMTMLASTFAKNKAA